MNNLEKDAVGFYTIEKYEAIKNENGEYVCGDLVSTEEHQNTMQNGFMYVSNVIGAACGGGDYYTYNATIDGVYYSSSRYWDVWKLGFNMAISTRKYYGPQINIYQDLYNTSAVNDNYDLIVGNWINGSTMPVYTAPDVETPGSCVYTRRFEPPSTITREINTILLYNTCVSYSYCRPIISVVQLDEPCYQYPNQILVIKYRILFNQNTTKYNPANYPSQAYLWMMTNEITNNINSSLSNTDWGRNWFNPYYMRAVAATCEPTNPNYIRNDLPTYKETTLNSCNNIDMIYTGTQSTSLAELPGKPFGSYVYRRYSDGWAKWQKKIRRPQDTVVQSTFGKTLNAPSILPFLDVSSIPNGSSTPIYADRNIGDSDTTYKSTGLVECQRVNVKSSGAMNTSTYNIQTRFYTAFASILNHKPEWVAMPHIINSATTGKLAAMPHTPHNFLQIEYNFPEFITYDVNGLIIYNTNPEIQPIVFDALTTPALPVTNIKQVKVFDSGTSSTIIIACGDTGLWKISRTYESVGYNTCTVTQIAPSNVTTPNNCNGFCVFDYEGNRDSTKKWYALFGMQLATSVDQGATWVVDSSFAVDGLTVELAKTNIYGMKIDPTNASENLFINWPSVLYPNSIFYNKQGYDTGSGVMTSGGKAGRGIWYSLSTKVSTIVSVPGNAINIRWGWEYCVICYNNMWYFSRFSYGESYKYLYYVAHNAVLTNTYTICTQYNSTYAPVLPAVFIPTRKFVNGVPQYIFHTSFVNTSNDYANTSYLVNASYIPNISNILYTTPYDTSQVMQINNTTYNASCCYIGRGLFAWMSSGLCYMFHGWDVLNSTDCRGTLWEPHVWDTWGWDGTKWSTSVSTNKTTTTSTDITPSNLQLTWSGYTNTSTDFVIDDYYTTYIFDGIFKDDSTSFSLTQYIEASISNSGTSFTPSILPVYSNVLSAEAIRVWNWYDAYRDFTPAGQCTTVSRTWDRNNTSSITMWPYLIKENFRMTFNLSSGSGYDDSKDYLDWKSQGFGFVFRVKDVTDSLLLNGGDFTSATTNFCGVNIQYPRSSTLDTAKTVNCQVWLSGVKKLTTTITNYDPKLTWSIVKNIDGSTGSVTVDIVYNGTVIYTCAIGASDIYYFSPAAFTRQDTSGSYTRGVTAWNIKLYGTDYQPKIAVGDGVSTGIWDSNFCYLHMYLYTLGIRTMALNGTNCTVNANSNRLPAPGELTMTSGGYILYNAADTGKTVSGSWRHSLMPTV